MAKVRVKEIREYEIPEPIDQEAYPGAVNALDAMNLDKDDYNNNILDIFDLPLVKTEWELI